MNRGFLLIVYTGRAMVVFRVLDIVECSLNYSEKNRCVNEVAC